MGSISQRESNLEFYTISGLGHPTTEGIRRDPERSLRRWFLVQRTKTMYLTTSHLAGDLAVSGIGNRQGRGVHDRHSYPGRISEKAPPGR